MKRILALLSVFLLVFATSCKKNDEPSNSDQKDATLSISLDFKVITSGSFDVDVTCSGLWKAESDKSWARLSIGGGVGDSQVTITVDPGAQDYAIVTFTAGELTATLNIVRSSDGADVTYLTLSSTNIYKRGSFSTTIKVNSSSQWTASCDKNWVSVSPIMGQKGQTDVTISFPDGEDGNAVVTFMNVTNTAKYEITRRNDIPRLADGMPDFTTLTENGRVSGSTFSVATNRKVYFAMGNLQYNSMQNKWRFAEKPWETIGETNSGISQYYNQWIDLFGWGTSGVGSFNVPWQTASSGEAMALYGDFDKDIVKTDKDWGYYNAISNGGNAKALWRTMTSDEWNYLLNQRANAANRRGFAFIDDNDKRYGLVLLPDTWQQPSNAPALNPTTPPTYTVEQWYRMMKAGAVFLPAAGQRYSSGVSKVNVEGHYWTGSVYYKVKNGEYYFGAYQVQFLNTRALTVENIARWYGCSVRLVQNVK